MVWAVEDGETVNFWEDRWTDLEKTLGELAVSPIPEKERSCKVADYVLPNGTWDGKRLRSFLPVETHPSIAAVNCPNSGNEEDKLLWKWTKDGSFSAATAMNYCTSETGIRLIRSGAVWSWKGPERVRTFLWLVTQMPC